MATKRTPNARTPKGAYAAKADDSYRESVERSRGRAPVVLRHAMNLRGITIAELADIMGVSTAAVRHRLSGRTDISFAEVVAICVALDVHPMAFIEPGHPLTWDPQTA